MSATQNTFDQTVTGYLEPLNNEYIKAALALFLILYAGVVAPKLPSSILRWFDNIFVKIFVFFMIVWISKKDPTVALIASIAVLVTLMIANNQFTTLNTSDQSNNETFCSCDTSKSNGQTGDSYLTSPLIDSRMEQVDQTAVNGWYQDTENENEYGIVEVESNEPYYPDHQVQITKIVTPSPTTVAPKTNRSSVPKTNRSSAPKTNRSSVPKTNRSSVPKITRSSVPKLTRSSVPKITRLPLIDPEYPDHTHRMPTIVPTNVFNNGKSVTEPSHPDHQTLANKKEHQILNGYMAEPSHPDHQTLANKKEHQILNGYMAEPSHPDHQTLANKKEHQILNGYIGYMEDSPADEQPILDLYMAEPSHPDHHASESTEDHHADGHMEESTDSEYQMSVNEKDGQLFNNYSEKPSRPDGMTLKNIKQHYLEVGYVEGRVDHACHPVSNNKNHRFVDGFVESESHDFA